MPPQIFILRMRPVPPGHEGKPGDWDRVPEALEENHLNRLCTWLRSREFATRC